MKKFAAVCIGLGCMFTVTGCGNNVTLNKEQNDLVAEYIGGVMLKHSYENQWEYQKLNAAKAQNTDSGKTTGTSTGNKNTATQPTQPATMAGNAAGSATTAASTKKATENETKNISSAGDVMASMKQALGLNTGIDVSYGQVLSGNRYPEGDFVVSVPANKSCVLVAVEFQLINNTDAEVTVNTASSKVSMKLGIEGTTFSKSATILKNDITGLKSIAIAPGQSYTAAAVFQIPEVFADSLEGATLTAYHSGSVLGTMELKK